MFRLRATPLFAELKDLDLRPHPPHGIATHHAAQRLKSKPHILIPLSCFKTGTGLGWPEPISAIFHLILQAFRQLGVGITAGVPAMTAAMVSVASRATAWLPGSIRLLAGTVDRAIG
jgi:hypothetical protein